MVFPGVPPISRTTILGALRVVVEDRDAVLVEAIGALSPGLMESFKEIEAEAVRRGVSQSR